MGRRLLPLPLAGEGRGEGEATTHARTLRHEATPAEAVLWRALRSRGIGAKFRRQVPCGPYFLDFAAVQSGLVIEVDGDTHATDHGLAHDARRDAWLASRNLRVLRFGNRDVLGNLDGVLAVISEALAHPHPGPLPQAGEGAIAGRRDPALAGRMDRGARVLRPTRSTAGEG